jgi:hypothetical protein
MKLQFLPDDAGKSHLIRLFDFDTSEARLLQDSLRQLAEGETESISLHELPFITAFNGIEVTAMFDDRLRNPDSDFAIIGGGATSSFIWRGTLDEWRATCDLLEPFTQHCDVNSYAWLTDDLGVQLLVSSSGSW